MKSPENGYGMNVPDLLRCPRQRLQLFESLMRPGRVVKVDVLGHEAPEMLLTDDQEVVEQLPPQCADEPLRECVHVWRPWCRADHAGADGLERRREARSKLRVPIADEQ